MGRNRPTIASALIAFTLPLWASSSSAQSDACALWTRRFQAALELEAGTTSTRRLTELDAGSCDQSAQRVRAIISDTNGSQETLELDVSPFADALRPRVAAMWIAEHLRALPAVGAVASPAPALLPEKQEAVGDDTAEIEPAPSQLEVRGLTLLGFRHDVSSEALGPGIDAGALLRWPGELTGTIELTAGSSYTWLAPYLGGNVVVVRLAAAALIEAELSASVALAGGVRLEGDALLGGLTYDGYLEHEVLEPFQARGYLVGRMYGTLDSRVELVLDLAFGLAANPLRVRVWGPLRTLDFALNVLSGEARVGVSFF